MTIDSQIKKFVLRNLQNIVFFLAQNFPFLITLIVARLSRKLLFREHLTEKKSFKSFQEYRDFIEITLKSISTDNTNSYINNHTSEKNRNNNSKELTGKKVFFICCDENQFSDKRVPAIFLDVWRDTAVEAGLITKVSVANEFLYNKYPKSNSSKNEYVRRLIEEIKTFQADIIFIDTNFFPSKHSLNGKDMEQIKTETSVPIYGHIGDMINDDGVECACSWLCSIDGVFHSNIEKCNIGIHGLQYIPYTCSTRRYFPEDIKNIPCFFSGVGNIARLWYILLTLKFTKMFLPNSRINFFKASQRTSENLFEQNEYDSIVRHAYSILDLTHRSRYIQNTSGRMFQALASASMLVAEECSALNKILKPFVEYLPFRNGGELIYALTLIRDEPKLCDLIAKNGARKFKECHNPQKIWNEIFRKAKISL